ncbi:MAG: hypothetical protein LBU60_00645 [Clostridiales bacterium]|jgi:hypothetical protein|nr:hypothetical protein [Clostridiales bacterium]
MFEGMLIVCWIYACLFLPMKGKNIAELSDKQSLRLDNSYKRYKTRMDRKLSRNTQAKVMTKEEYLISLGKQGLTYLIFGIILIPIYILVIVFLYPRMIS